MKLVSIYLRSGQTIIIKCRSFECEHLRTTGEVTSWKAEGLEGASPVYIKPDEIMAVMSEDL